MFKNIYFRLGLISAITTLAFLAVIPRTPIVIKNSVVNIDTSIGGYFINLFGGRFTLDLTELQKGLDLEGGIRVTLRANMTQIPQEDREGALESAREVISRRVNLLGVSEPYIATATVGEEYRIIVEIPGVSDINAAVGLIGQTAQLKFKQLKPEYEWSEEKFQEYFYDNAVWEDTNVNGSDLRGVDVVFQNDPALGNTQLPSIQLRFSNEGRQEFAELAKDNINKPVALFLDEDATPLSMPVVNENLAQGVIADPVISGNFDIQTARNLSLQIRAGALPVPVEILEQQTIGATLGEESVNRSFFAGFIGLVFVLIFLVYLYGRLGFMADIALIIYTLIVLAIFKIVPVVLTLPGIAGFILSIGMASDANILIFERIKEELDWGSPRGVAVKYGFQRAWSSIKDSNISSLLTAGVLFYFGDGPVRGFALTLSIGIIVSLFTSIFVTRTLITVFNVIPGEKEEGQSKLSNLFSKFREVQNESIG